MISIKKYLDSDQPTEHASETESNELISAAMECYRAVLLAVGKTAAKVSPGLGVDLEMGLQGIARRLYLSVSPDLLAMTEKQVEVQLQEWGSRTSGYLKEQADGVKELLIALARTAESVGSRDQGYTSRFMDLTGRLEKIADLNDLTQVRSSLVERVSELKNSVDQMSRENTQLVSQLRAEISICETRLTSGRA